MIEHVGIILTGSVMIIIIAYLALDQLLTFIWRNDDKATADKAKKPLRQKIDRQNLHTKENLEQKKVQSERKDR